MTAREARFVLTWSAVAALCVMAPMDRLVAQDPERVRQATREVFRSADYEVDGRFESIVGQTESPIRGRQPREARRRSAAPPDAQWDFSSEILAALMWIVLGAALVFALAWVIRALLAGPLPDSDPPETASRKPLATGTTSPRAPQWEPRRLAEAEEAAARGDYAAAVHILWLATLGPIAQLMGRPLAPAETSREILHEAPLSPTHHPAVERLVGTVERSLFGGRAIGESDYQRAREAFALLTAPASQGRA
jgi:hypothetical protein